MARQTDSERKVAPISVAVTKGQREQFEAEARRRGMGVSTTIRALALERAGDLARKRQLERALAWQTKEAIKASDLIEAGQNPEVSWAEVDALFKD